MAMSLLFATSLLIATAEAAGAFTVAVDSHDCELSSIMLCHSPAHVLSPQLSSVPHPFPWSSPRKAYSSMDEPQPPMQSLVSAQPKGTVWLTSVTGAALPVMAQVQS
jgi:hypothetical protein